MLIHEYNTGSRFNERDLLTGSSYIERGKFRTKNFKLKDVLQHVRAGLPEQGGSFSIKIVEQEESDPASSPAELVNQEQEGIVVPEYAILFVRMNKNTKGDCDETYLFTRNSNEFGANATPVLPEDFIFINANKIESFRVTLSQSMESLGLSKSNTQQDFNNKVLDMLESSSGQSEEQGSFSSNKEHNRGSVFVETGGNNISMFIPTLLPSEFEAKYIQVGSGDVTLTMGDSNKLNGKNKIGGDGHSVTIIKRKKDSKIWAV